MENFQIKNSGMFHITSHNIDYGYSLEPPWRGGSNEYTKIYVFSKIRKIMYTPYKSQFFYIKMGFKGSKLYRRVFVLNFYV